MTATSKRLCEQAEHPYVIAEDINNDGAKQFHGFNTIYSMMKYVDAQPVKHFHEVMKGLGPRKLYFDADRKVEDGPFPDMLDFVNDMRETLIKTIKALFNVDIENNDICFTESHTINKFSSHIIIPSLNTSVDNMNLLYKFVSGAMSARNPIYGSPLHGTSILDPAVYKSNQTLRMINCSKMGKDNTKKLWNKIFSDMDTIVSYLEHSTAISLIPSIQAVVDKRREKSTGQRLSAVAKSPELFKAIVNALNKSRADNFIDWQRVCLALGHENAGPDIALMFAGRSEKYNEVATMRLYDKGASSTNESRHCTIGTLFHMLKQDNPEEFRKIQAMSFEGESDEARARSAMYSTSNIDPDIINTIKAINADESDNEDDDYANAVSYESDGDDEPAAEPNEVKLTGEQKLRRWLSAPEYYLPEPVNNPMTVLNEEDTTEIYNERYMKEYPAECDTIGVVGNKAAGKTHALVEHIKKTNPEYILYVSFRRSFSNEIVKRLAPLGFVNYRDIDGPITNEYKRVVIQVESLPRLRWDKKCDLFVLDEIESIRDQFMSPTCKRREVTIDKYSTLLRTSKQVIFMDADISENTITHVKDTRGKPIHYIKNTHQEVQANFKEYYTTDINKVMRKLCDALDVGHKIVIPTNRSVAYMESMNKTIARKYPELKIQMYNSKTIRNPDTAAELVNIEESWIKYDVLIYSPTISAGVSFDIEHFDSCFCIFTNNGKINAMRQMISRVRKFSTNTFHYCLQSFGGSSKPTSIEAYEKYICSNRFLDKPEFIKSIDDYDGARQYPYKDVGYYLWIYHQTEKVRDKNMFLYNFLREQYHSGICQMAWLNDEVAPASAPITKAEISDVKTEIIANENAAIAEAIPIDDIEKAHIIKRLDNEEPITETERYQLLRRNLLDCYDLNERTLTPEFVAEYNVAGIKAAYHNRKALAAGLDNLVELESRYFNMVCARDDDGPTIQDDLNKKYRGAKMVIAKELIEIVGFSGFYDTAEISKDTMLTNFKAIEETLIKKMPHICDVFGRDKRHRPDIAKWTDNTYLRKMLDFINSMLSDLFQLKIKQKGSSKRSGKYTITGIDKYKFD